MAKISSLAHYFLIYWFYEVTVASVLADPTHGCGGKFSQSFGIIHLNKSDYSTTKLQCNWTIGNTGIANAVIVLSMKELRFDYCWREFLKVFSKSGTEIFTRERCYQVQQGVVELQFGEENSVTLQTQLYSRRSRLKLEFVVIRRSFRSAPQLDGWNVTVLNVSESSISFQWPKLTDVRGNQVRGYVVIVETTDGKEVTGDIFLANVTFKTTHGLKGSTEYRIFVTVVDQLGQPHRSSEVLVITDEGVPSRSPYLSVDKKHHGVDNISISIYPIDEEYHNGKLLGYNILYETLCYGIPKSSGQVSVSPSTKSYILTGLLPGTKYRIRITGFTSKGIGPYDSEDAFTTCEPRRTLIAKNGTLYSPNYPCSFSGYHYCRWTIEPQLSGSAVKTIWIDFNSFDVDGDGSHCRSNDWLRVATGEDAQYDNGTLLCGYIKPFSLVIHDDQSELALHYTKAYRSSNGFSVWYLGLDEPLIDNDLSSWHLSVYNITSSSVFVAWTEFPLNVSITHFMVMFTKKNTNLSVLLRVKSLYDQYYFVDKLLKPHQKYEFQVLAFTGSAENVTYSTEIQTITTGEGGKDRVAKI